MICIATVAGVIALASPTFTLSWTHSVARTHWSERWEATPAGLRPIEASIEGPGAGMELPDTAWRDGAVWHYRPTLPPQAEVFLAASGATPSGWTLCTPDHCQTLGTTSQAPIRLWQAPNCPP